MKPDWYKQLKPGDVVEYGDGAAAIVADPPLDYGSINFERWGYHADDPMWYPPVNREGGGGSLRHSECKPHPDPDRVWADYCAAVLLGGSNNG